MFISRISLKKYDVLLAEQQTFIVLCMKYRRFKTTVSSTSYVQFSKEFLMYKISSLHLY